MSEIQETETIDEFEVFIKEWTRQHKYVQGNAQKSVSVTKRDIDDFNKVWQAEFLSSRGRHKKEYFDYKKERDYRDCLFTIYKNHWDSAEGFQINMKTVGKRIEKSYRTVDRMILFFMECGLLVRCHNYMAGKQTYFYHKNGALFKHLYQGETQEYSNWLKDNKLKSDVNNYKYKNYRLIKDSDNNECTIDNTEASVDTNKKRGRKKIMYKANTELYEKIVNDFLSIYEKLNEGQHKDLQIDFGLHFNERGDYSGRSRSYFCSTLNEKKEHKDDNTMETRSDFLKRVGLGDYQEIYDIKSEVPRTTILANTGIWKSDDFDIYDAMVKECGFTFQDEIIREEMKKLYMRFNFEKGTLGQSYSHYRDECVREIVTNFKLTCGSCKNQKCENRNKRRCENHTWAKNYYEKMLDNYEQFSKEYWGEIARAVEKIQGKSCGNLVFWWTSLIQVYTIYKILEEKNIRVYNVYDGFYASKSSGLTKKYMVDMVKKSALYIYKKYMKGVKELEIV